AGRLRGEERGAGDAALLFRPRAADAAGARAVRLLRARRAVRHARAGRHRAAPAPGDFLAEEIHATIAGGAAHPAADLAMEFEYWWLLGFPLFFGLGWMAARIDIKQIVSESRALPRSYFKGLNFLLNEQPDKAIEAFIEVVKVDPETVELHFALGSLFRRRGEYDRAIRMHQNLLERADLGPEQKLQAQMELGQDYLKAGILDRAEEVFTRIEKTSQAIPARRFLLEIYEQEKDWPRAIEMTKQVETDPRSRSTCASSPPPSRRSRGPMRRGATSTRRSKPTASACGPACSWVISKE